MIDPNKPNPFEVLGLPCHASNAEIVNRGKELSELESCPEKRLLYRWAVEQLITKPLLRLEYELFEAPATRYEDPEWEDFLRRHRRMPIDLAALAQECPLPSLADFRVAALLQWFLDDLLDLPPGDIRVAIAHLPICPEAGPPPLEVHHVIFG